MVNRNLLISHAGLESLDCYSKFDELICFIQNVNTQHLISVICLNECWISQENDTAGLHIEGHNMFLKGEQGLAMATVDLSYIFMKHF